MKLFLLLYSCFCFLITSAQNVGVGTTTPTEKLDVNGNVNVSGTIKANGVAGTNGQVLMSTGSGLSWGSLLNYKKCVMFTTTGSATWTVPAGVTEVMVEVWGAGSGGTAYCGGTSGGYARSVQAVTPGYVINYTVGAGSSQGTNATADGGNSQITVPFGYILAAGGGGIPSVSGRGQVNTGTTSLSNYFFMPGNSGEPNTSTYGQKNAGTFVEWKQFGAGGTPVGLLNSTPLSGDLMYYENGSNLGGTYSYHAKLAGAGGAAGSGSGWSGGNGMIVIWFNN